MADRLNLNNSVASRELSRKFGYLEDIVELHIYNSNGNLLSSDYDFKNYSFPEGTLGSLSTELNISPNSILEEKGFTSGKYKVVLNIQRKKIFNVSTNPFSLKEISNSRQELRVTTTKPNSDLDPNARSFIGEIESSIFFKDFILNFGDDQNILGVNILLNTHPNKHELLIKLLEPLPPKINLRDTFSIREEITNPITFNIDLGEPQILDTSIPLQGPNFKIDVRLNNSIPSSFKSYDDVLEYNLTSSYQNLLSKLEENEVPEITYDYIRPVSESLEAIDIPTHFENFVHFSSAVERLKNFEYKVKLIELYDSQLVDINNITGNTSSSISVLNNKNSINTKKTNLLKGLDGYEYFLYYTSGAYAWPKSDLTTPYTLYSVTSSEAQTWLGSEKDTYPSYGGQLLSASIFDRQNDYALVELIPHHITDNPSNDFYKTFINMIGQHFDQIWTHIDHLTKINDTHQTRGISKDLVYFQLKSLGIDTFDQFENSNLIEYILGHGTGSSTFYSSPATQTLVTASNAGSIPKGDITKNIWKRLYHNAPYLLKTKGTERGLKALMSCYGVPSTLLNVKEYGGSTSDKTTYQTFSYEKSGLALQGDSGTSGYFIKTGFTSASNIPVSLNSSNKTIQFRIKPVRSDDNYHLITLSGSILSNVYQPSFDPILILKPYIGNDISSSGDSENYGRLELYQSGALEASTSYFPAYNNKFWNIHMGSKPNDQIEFGAYQSNFNKNISYYIGTSDGTPSAVPSFWANGVIYSGSSFAYIGGMPSNSHTFFDNLDDLRYSGSIQEVRYHFGELLSHDTLVKHALEPFMYAGNTITSSYEGLVLRLPLGSNDIEDSSSFHPDIDTTFIPGGVSSSMTTQTWEEVIETHHLPTPDTVGASMTSEKVRIDTGTINDDILSSKIKSETSTLDRQPQDFEDLGVFFSPTTEINEDIIYTLGAFRMDDYIGSPLPSAQTSDDYADLKDLKDTYFKKVNRRYNYWDYIKLIQYIDHTLFKIIEQWVPMKANLKTGLLIEPHYLERNKFAREVPVIDYGQTMNANSYQTFEFQIDPERAFSLEGSPVSTNNLSFTTGSTGQREETGTNVTINVNSYILDEPQIGAQAPITPYSGSQPVGYVAYRSNTLLGNVTKGKASSRYYRSLDDGKEHDFVSIGPIHRGKSN